MSCRQGCCWLVGGGGAALALRILLATVTGPSEEGGFLSNNGDGNGGDAGFANRRAGRLTRPRARAKEVQQYWDDEDKGSAKGRRRRRDAEEEDGGEEEEPAPRRRRPRRRAAEPAPLSAAAAREAAEERAALAIPDTPPPRTRPPTPAPPPPTPVPTEDESLDTAACQSWSNTVEVRRLWASRGRGRVADPWPRRPGLEDTPPCSKRKKSRRLQVIGDAPVQTHTIAESGGWWHNKLSRQDVLHLRQGGVLDQMYVDHEMRILFCAVPKAGCTALKAWMLRNAGLFKSAGTVHNRSLYQGPRLESGAAMTNAKMLDVMNSGEYFKFTVVRNPYTRTLATFLERYQSCTPFARKRRPAHECAQWRRALHGQTDYDASTHPSFLDYLKELRRNGAAQTQKRTNFLTAHWVPSSKVCGVHGITYDYIARLENPNDTQVVYDLTSHVGFSDKERKRLEHSEGTSKKLRAFYSAETLEAVADLYKEDIELLGYSQDAVGIVPKRQLTDHV